MIKFTKQDVKKLRKDLGMTQAQRAKAMSVSPALVGNIEQGAAITDGTNWKLNRLVMVANYLIGERWNPYRESLAEIDRIVDVGVDGIIAELPAQVAEHLGDYHAFTFRD